LTSFIHHYQSFHYQLCYHLPIS